MIEVFSAEIRNLVALNVISTECLKYLSLQGN